MNNKNEFPFWVEKVLKGICYWIAYKKTLYTHSESNVQIPELAIHTEIWSILSLYRSGEKYAFNISPEKPYKDIIKETTNYSLEEIKGLNSIFKNDGPSADIVIYSKLRKNKSSKNNKKEFKISHVIEIKKYEGNNKKVNKNQIKTELDEIKILQKYSSKKIKYYMMIFSQDIFLKIFLKGKEVIRGKIKKISDTNNSKVPISRLSKEKINEKFKDIKIKNMDYFFVNKNKYLKTTKNTIKGQDNKKKTIETSGIISGIVLEI